MFLYSTVRYVNSYACKCTLSRIVCASRVKDPKECIVRKWDQTFIHIGSIIYTMYTNYLPFIFINIMWNEYCIYYLWTKNNTSLRRRIHIYISIIMFISPVLWTGHIRHFLKMLHYLTLGSMLFIKNDALYGYGHSLFHICMAVVAYYLNQYCLISKLC